MKKTLEKAAKQGRFGDDSLIHVSKHEIKGLASLVPGGKLPTNPHTGLHEAFFFLPFLAAAAAAAPAAAAAAAPVVAGLGTAAAGLGAAGAAGAGAAGLAGLGAAAAPAAMTAASALPAAAGSSLLGSAATSGVASGLAASSPALTGGAALGSTVASTAPGALGLGAAAPTAAAAAPGAAAGSGLGGLVAPTNFLGGVPTGAMPSVTGLNAAAAPASSAAAPASALPSQAVQNASLQAAMTARPDVAGAAAGGAKGGLGGLFGNMDMGKMLQYGALGAMMLPKGGGGKDDDGKSKDVNAKQYSRGDEAQPADQGNSGGVSGEFNYFPRAHYFAKGGLASLGGGGGSDSGTSDQELISATEQAIQTQSPDSQQIIQEFIAKFGPEALQHLVMQIQQQSGDQGAQGDGMSDSVPAQLSGQGGSAPAQLSEGEYIMPADVVAHLGNGSTQAGAKQLDGMQARVRAMRGAPSEGPNQIDPQQVLPA